MTANAVRRLAIVTVGMTHSGKSTFARELAGRLANALVIDPDNHAEFLNAHYAALVPKTGANRLKVAITETIFEHAIAHSDAHLILCNGNRYRTGRTKLLHRLRRARFTTVLVYFDLPSAVLEARIRESCRTRSVLRTASDFGEVLARQIAESSSEEAAPPMGGEGDVFFRITDPDATPSVIQNVLTIT